MSDKTNVAVNNLLMSLTALQGDLDAVTYKKESELDEIHKKIEAEVEVINKQYNPELTKLKDDIKVLESRIKRLALIKKSSFSYEKSSYSVIFFKGRISWNTDKLEGLAEVYDEILNCRKIGKPYTVVRKKK